VVAAVDALRAGRFVVVADPNDVHDQGDVVIAAEHAGADAVNFMATHARGLVRLCLSDVRCRELELRPIGRTGETRHGTTFMTSIEARTGVSTGISAADRARTIAVAIDPGATGVDLVRPGHIFPLRARPDGVLERARRPEASVELARLAGLTPAAVSCQILRDDGAGSSLLDLEAFCSAHGLPMVSVAQVADHCWCERRDARTNFATGRAVAGCDRRPQPASSVPNR
jgi:3,4-dihydroxy 2-butanone 4-phosphate synthase/GTP cyclohydrolase II